MKNSRRGVVFGILFFFFAINSYAQDISEKLRDFSELKTFNAVEVVVVPSEENRIEISGHSKDKVKYNVNDGRLEIRLSLDNIWSKDNTIIRVYGNSLSTIDANEGSQIRIEGTFETKQLVLRVQEGSNITAQIKADKLISKAVTGGSLALEGKVAEQEIEVNSGGRFFGSDLRSKKTTVTCGTAGRAEVYASEYCKATARLGGVIEVFGRPGELDTKTSLGGRIL